MHPSFGNLSDKCSQALILSFPLWAWLSKYFSNDGTNANQFFKKKIPQRKAQTYWEMWKMWTWFILHVYFLYGFQASIWNVKLIWDESGEVSESIVSEWSERF